MTPAPTTGPRGGTPLLDALAAHARLRLYVRTIQGFSILPSRLVAGRPGRWIAVACPEGVQPGDPGLTPGRTVGVSLRHENGKCLFEALVIGPDPDAPPATTLRLTWPDEIQELQRRLHHRTPVPGHLRIPVDLARQPADDADDPTALPRRGILADLSAGGMSVTLPADPRPRWRPGDRVNCRFAIEPDRPPHTLAARLRHVETAPQGDLRMGLQFEGLEASPMGRHTLRCLARAQRRFRHALRPRPLRHL